MAMVQPIVAVIDGLIRLIRYKIIATSYVHGSYLNIDNTMISYVGYHES